MPVLDAALACRGDGGTQRDPRSVTALDLRGKGVNAVSLDIGKLLPNLGKLDLGDNVLSNDALVSLATIVSLKHLNLANNGLGGDALRVFLKVAPAGGGSNHDGGDGTAAAAKTNKKAIVQARRGKASRLKLNNGSTLNGGLPSNTTNGGVLPLLRVLNLSGNELTSLSGIVAGAPNLGALIASDNRIEDLSHVKSLTNLNTVVASSNKITTLGDAFENLVNLNKLSLSHNEIEALGDSLKNCGELRELRLARNKLKSLPKVSLQHQKNLRVLDVSGNQFCDFGDVEVLRSLTKLNQLSLQGSPLATQKGYAKTVAKMCPQLKTLDGRKIGPGGWMEKEKTNATKTDKSGKSTKPTPGDASNNYDYNRPDPWADARAAAGLEPLEGATAGHKVNKGASTSSSSDDEDDDDDDDSDDDDENEDEFEQDASESEEEEEEEMDDEERSMMAEVTALRAKARAENGDTGKVKSEKLKKPKSKKNEKKSEKRSSEPGADGSSFLQEMVARNVGTVKGFDRESEGDKKKTDEKNANRTRSGVVKVIEVKQRNTTKNALTGTALAAAFFSATRAGEDDAWGGWGVEESPVKETKSVKTPSSKKKMKRSADDDAGGDVVLISSSKKKKKKRASDSGGFDPGNSVSLDSAVKPKKKTENGPADDPWNGDAARAIRKKKEKNMLARRYKK